MSFLKFEKYTKNNQTLYVAMDNAEPIRILTGSIFLEASTIMLLRKLDIKFKVVKGNPSIHKPTLVEDVLEILVRKRTEPYRYIYKRSF